MTKKQFEETFREEVLPYVVERYEQDGIPDKPARSEAWNNTIDAYIRDRTLPEAAGNWSHPRWLETYRPRGTSHATKKSKSKMAKTYTVHGHFERQSRSGGVMNETYSHWTRTGLSKSAADQLAREQRAEGGVARVVPENGNGNGSSRRHATKKSPAQLQREINEALRQRAMGLDPAQVGREITEGFARQRALEGLTPAQREYVSLFEQDVREHPGAFKAMVRDDPRAYALLTIGGLDDREVRQSTRELRAERKKVARLTGHSTKKRWHATKFAPGDPKRYPGYAIASTDRGDDAYFRSKTAALRAAKKLADEKNRRVEVARITKTQDRHLVDEVYPSRW